MRALLYQLTKTRMAGFERHRSAAAAQAAAVTVLLVGLVDAGLLDYGQAFSIMLGANVGTTFTLQLLALSRSLTPCP